MLLVTEGYLEVTDCKEGTKKGETEVGQHNLEGSQLDQTIWKSVWYRIPHMVKMASENICSSSPNRDQEHLSLR